MSSTVLSLASPVAGGGFSGEVIVNAVLTMIGKNQNHLIPIWGIIVKFEYSLNGSLIHFSQNVLFTLNVSFLETASKPKCNLLRFASKMHTQTTGQNFRMNYLDKFHYRIHIAVLDHAKKCHCTKNCVY